MAVFESCKAGLSNYERIMSEDQALKALEEGKIWITFFEIPYTF